MTTDEALLSLRPDWHLSRGDDVETSEAGWVVSYAPNGEGLWRLGWGATVADAVAAAVQQAEREEREEAERRADYARRKAAGQLTDLERIGEEMVGIWAEPLLAHVEATSVLASRIDRAYETVVAGTGKPLTIVKIGEFHRKVVPESEA